MVELGFACTGARVDPYAATPTLRFTIRVTEHTGVEIGAIALRCQFRVEPIRRRYSDTEAERLDDIFGDRSRWAETQHAMQLATLPVMVPTFTHAVEVEVDVPCTYDMEVATSKYFHSLDDGEIPLLILFSGSVFVAGGTRLHVEQVPWANEVHFRLPVATWRSMMDGAFPNAGWLRLQRQSIDGLRAYMTREAIPSWDLVVERLLKEAGWPAST